MDIASITTLAPLALLACPVGMGLMMLIMWMMGRGSKSEEASSREPLQAPAQPASVEVIRKEQRRLAEEIERLERQQASDAEAGEPR